MAITHHLHQNHHGEGAVSGGGELSQIEERGLEWRGEIASGGELSQAEGNELR